MDYNPFSAEVLEDPFPSYAELRGTCPVHHFEGHQPPFFTLTRYQDVVDAVMDRGTWSARYGISPQFQRGVGFNADGTEHIEFRRAVLTAFSGERIKAMEPEIAALVDELVEGVLAHGPGVDLHEMLAAPLPVTVIARMLGIEGDLGEFKRLSDELMTHGMNSSAVEPFLRVREELDAYWESQLAPRREALAGIEDPGEEHLGTLIPDDLMSALLTVRLQGRLLTPFEINNSLMNLLLAGNETTTSLLTNVLWRLLEAPERWEALRADRDLVDIAIEESLRFDAPVLGMFRTTLCPVDVQGVTIGEKSKVMVAYAAANRDPDVFDDPEEFRLDRSLDDLRRHIAFGKGSHMCPGAPLSRIEARLALGALLDRIPDLRLDGRPERIAPFNFWGRRTLPVTWS